MGLQTKASFKKEALAFIRTGKLLIASIVIIGLAALSPLPIAGLASQVDAMSDIYSEFGIDVSGMTAVTEDLTEASSAGVSMSVSYVAGIGLIVFLLLINRAAGGEQKKRDVIIPRSSGLRSFGYIFPKFIIYPLTAFILAIVAMFASWGVSSYAFKVNDVALSQALLAGALAGLCMMFYVCFHLTLGTATGKPGMSAAVCIAASIILPAMFTTADTDYMFNPFGLIGLAMTVVSKPNLTGAELRDIAATVAFMLVLLVLSYLIALFAQNSKKVDNTGNEMEL